MFASIRRLRLEWRDRPDSEHVQAVLRLVAATLILICLVGLSLGRDKGSAAVDALLFVIVVETLLSLGIVAAIVVHPGTSPLRRAVGMLGDYATLAALMTLGDETLSPLYVVLLWVTLDNGQRYGARSLYQATGLCLGAFAIPLLSSGYWQQNQTLGGGLFLALAAIPLYLFARLPRARRAPMDTQGAGSTAHTGIRLQSIPAAAPDSDAGRFVVHQTEPGRMEHASGSGKVIAFDDPFVRHRARVRPLRVLVADNQLANRLMLQRLLRRAGHAAVFAENGDEALGRIQAGSVDAAIVELQMPGLSGIEVIKHVRMIEAGRRRTPIAVVGAGVPGPVALEAESCGAFAVLTRPLAAVRLLQVLAEMAGGGDKALAAKGFDVMPAISAVSLDVLQELAAMNLGGEFVACFVEQCLHDAGRCLDELERAGDAAQWEALREAAYALKGLCENLGAQAVVEGCSQIMRANAPGLSREWRRYVARLDIELRHAARLVRNEARRLGQGSVGSESATRSDT